MSLNDAERKALAGDIATALRGQCSLGLSLEDGETLRQFCRTLRSARSAALVTFVGLVIAGTAGLLVAGLWSRVRDLVR